MFYNKEEALEKVKKIVEDHRQLKEKFETVNEKLKTIRGKKRTLDQYKQEGDFKTLDFIRKIQNKKVDSIFWKIVIFRHDGSQIVIKDENEDIDDYTALDRIIDGNYEFDEVIQTLV